MIFQNIIILLLLNYCKSNDFPTLYEYYTNGGINSSLEAEGNNFRLNGKDITIFSGSLHYFRVPQQLWKDRLLKFKAAGLNAVQFYSPWNLHEEYPGNFDFDSEFLNLTQFLDDIKEADMFAIYRPGPYICSEWELGGFPSWLLRDTNMKLRSNYSPYLSAVEKYFAKLISLVSNYQFYKNGGPIIALQIENEFGGYETSSDAFDYLTFLKNIVRKYGYEGLLFTSDPASIAQHNPIKKIEGILETVNMDANAIEMLTEVKKNQPNKPLYVSEYWSSEGWKDYWGTSFQRTAIQHFHQQFSDIVFQMNASLNVYMFFGGTNFGFMNGANREPGVVHPMVVTSYDYDAPLSESGNYTQKYWIVKELIEKFVKERSIPEIKKPLPPPVNNAVSYGFVNVTHYLSFDDILNKIEPIFSDTPVYMEMLNITENCGQQFGFILYRNYLQPKNSTSYLLKLSGGVSDRTIISFNYDEILTTYNDTDVELNITNENTNFASNTLDILVENTGRINVGNIHRNARKGVKGNAYIDHSLLTNWTIYPLEFRQTFIEKLSHENWKQLDGNETYKLALFKATLLINESVVSDTFIKLDNWTKGVVFVNGFNIGRYWNIGPQKSYFIPRTLLKTGMNQIYIFELHSFDTQIEFIDKQII